MRTRLKRRALLVTVLLLAACSRGTSSTGAPPGEDQALDEAAASLDANSPDTNAAVIVTDDAPGNEDQPQ